MATTFTEKLNKLNVLMDENRENSGRLKDENLNMRSKLKELYDQFQEREQHMLDMNKQIDLQNQLSHTQLKKLELEFATEREIWAKEKSVLLSRCERTEKTNLFLEDNVKSLQSHLEAYQKQFNEFENTIKQSNTVSKFFFQLNFFSSYQNYKLVCMQSLFLYIFLIILCQHIPQLPCSQLLFWQPHFIWMS